MSLLSSRTYQGAEPGTARTAEGLATPGPSTHPQSNAAVLEQMKADTSVPKSKPGLLAYVPSFGWVGDALASLQPTEGQAAKSGWSAGGSASGSTVKGTVGRVAADGPDQPWAMTGGLALESGGLSVGGTGAWDAAGAERAVGFGGRVHKDRWVFGGNVDTVYRRDQDGKAVDRIGGGASFGPSGASFQGSRTRDGNAGGFGLSFADGQAGATVSATRKTGEGVTAGVAFGDSAMSGSFGGSYKGKGASVSFHAVDDRGMASISDASEPARWFGETAVSYGLHDASSVGGKASAKMGPATLGFRGYVADSQTTSYHTTMSALVDGYDAETMKALARARVGVGPLGYVEPIDESALDDIDAESLQQLASDHPDLFQSYLSRRFEQKVQAARTFESLDLAELGVGEAMRYQSGEAWGASGSVSAYGVGVSLGIDDQSIQELTIGKDADGRTRVKVSAMDETAMKASIGAGFGAVGLSGTNTEGERDDVEFTVDDSPAGQRALEQFQQTGLLPGAMQAVQGQEGADELAAEWQSSVDALSRLDAEIALQTDPAARTDLLERRALARAELTQASGALNRVMLERDRWDLQVAQVPGVHYPRHQMATHQSDKTTLSLGGWSWSWGDTFSEYTKKYQKNGATEREFGGAKQTDYLFDEDEQSTIVTNPEELAFNGHEIELGMFSEQDPSARERRVLGGLKYGGMREIEAREYGSGDFDSDEMVQVSLAMSGAQIDYMREAFAGGDAFWKEIGTQADEYDWTARFPGLRGASEGVRETIEDNSVARALASDPIARAIEEDLNGGFRTAFYEAEWDRLTQLDVPILQRMRLRERMLGNIASVESAEDFAALSENEQGLAIGSYVMQSVRADDNPWEAAHMVLAIEDPEVRAKHFRTLFMTYEHATDGANATVDFIEWVQKEGASNGLDQTTIDDLLSGARVELVDERVEERADKLAGALNDPELLEQAGQWFAESADDIDLDETDRMLRKAGLGKALQIEADEAGDWVQAADRAGGPELVEQMVRAAADDNPWFVRRYLSNLNQIDGSRAKVVAEILAETESFGPAAQHYLDILEGELPWWAAAMPGPAAL